jgi:catechol 2,3-dioxygenase-like lactoylglutathione lyase family enzyme
MGITGLSHVGLSTPDLPRAVAFYRDVLGFAEVVSYSWPAGNDAADAGLGVTGSAADLTVLNAGNTYLEVLQFHSPLPRRFDDAPTLHRQGISHIGLEVRNLDEAAEHMLDGGAHALDPAHDASSPKSRLLRDPDGNILELRVTDAGDSLDYSALSVRVPTLADEASATAVASPRHDSVDRSHVRGIGHVGVATLGADALVEFYGEAGLGVATDTSWDLRVVEPVDATRAVSSAGRAVVMPVGNAYLELLVYHDVPVLPRPDDARIIEYGFNHLCFDIEDIGSTHAHLLTVGMTCFAPWLLMPGKNAAMGYALDPAGTPIELLEHRTTSSIMWPGHLSI